MIFVAQRFVFKAKLHITVFSKLVIYLSLIAEHISQVIYAKLEPELQALLRRLCTLLPEANADKRSAILGRLVQNMSKVCLLIYKYTVTLFCESFHSSSSHYFDSLLAVL